MRTSFNRREQNKSLTVLFYPCSKTNAKAFTPLTAARKAAQTSSEGRLVLYQFRPDWGVQAYLRFARIPHHIENSQSPEIAATGELPAVRDGDFLVGKDGLIEHFREHHADLDDCDHTNPSEEEKADAYAMVNNSHHCRRLRECMLVFTLFFAIGITDKGSVRSSIGV